MTLRVLSVASEVYPLVKTGGLADVTGALPAALAALDVATTTLVPGYPAVTAALEDASAVHRWAELYGGAARLLRGRAAGLDLLVLDAPHLYGRGGNPYVDGSGRDWPDNAARFAALARAGAAVALGETAVSRPDVVHGHDWQAGLIPAYLRYAGGRRPGTVMTVHNLAFQGLFGRELLGFLGLPPEAFALDGVEYHGMIGMLKAGLALADRITTVSPTYAAEIRTPDGGMGLDGLLRGRSDRLHGILNGIDTTVWDPARDPLLATGFSARRMGWRAANKTELRRRFGLAETPETLLLGVVSRLTWQKGLDLLLSVLDAAMDLGIQLAVLGTGEQGLEAGFAAAAERHPGRVGCVIGYDEGLAHLMQAGVDALIVPSRFEPCGLTQLCALRYGAVPVVARVGGLADTVIDANEAALAAGVATGVQFSPVTAEMLMAALGRTAALWADRPAWTRLQRNAMKADVSWDGPAAHYARVYRLAMDDAAS